MSALPRLFQLVSPALPVGGYTWSRGLETAVERGWVTDEAGAREWITGLLGHALARLDGPLLVRAHRALRAGDDAAVTRWARLYDATRETAELQHESQATGRALVRLLVDLELVTRAELPEDLAESERDDFAAILPEHALTFSQKWTLPSQDWFEAYLPEEDIDAMDELRGVIAHEEESQVLGWPEPVQGELLAGTTSFVLIQLGAFISEMSPYITDGLRYWFIDAESLTSKTLGEVWHEYQYT